MRNANRFPVYETTTVNGVTEQTLIGHENGPRDARAAVRTLMFRLAAGFTVLAMGLSIAAIGSLLGALLPAYVAFPVAAVFDGLWVYALLGEWMSQTHPKARRASQLSGLVFMLASMGAIVLEAQQRHMLAVGIIAALVPLGVKGAWWLRLETTTHRLPVAYQLRLEQIRDQVHTELAVELENRELDAARALTAELRNLRNPVPHLVPAVVLDRIPEPAEPIDWSGMDTVPQQVSAVPNLVPQVPHLVPSGSGFGTNVAGRTELLRNLIGTGTTDTTELRNRVEDAGFAAPSPEYVRRLVRTATKEN